MKKASTIPEENKEVSDKCGEAYTLFNLAMSYLNKQVNQPEKAAECLEQVIGNIKGKGTKQSENSGFPDKHGGACMHQKEQ